jgi:putative hemolysin
MRKREGMKHMAAPILPLHRGHYTARLAASEGDVAAAQALRHLAFRGTAGRDADAFDPLCRHLLVETSGTLVACCRLQHFGPGDDLQASYAAQTYDLTRLATFAGPKIELGRFCLHPARSDPDILRLIWAALTRVIDAGGVTLMFGCTSLPGADPQRHRAALATLRRHTAPLAFAPGQRAPDLVALPEGQGDPAALPPLLRSYLTLGAFVSDHAVIDRDLDTLHVLTALPVAQVPPARARALRALGVGESLSSG